MPPPSFRFAPVSPVALAWAALWASLTDLALVVMILAWSIDAWAPAQDLPWKPLRLQDPPGLATHMKLERAGADPAACRAVLREGGIDFADEPARGSGYCAIKDAVRLSGGMTPLSPPAPIMTCRQALAYVFWDRHALQPLARVVLGEPIAAVEHYGTYACRTVAGSERPSQHALANALDVSGLRVASGARLTVAGDFRDEDEGGLFLRAARTGACDWFGAVLSPDYNAAHADHLHLDAGRWRACR